MKKRLGSALAGSGGRDLISGGGGVGHGRGFGRRAGLFYLMRRASVFHRPRAAPPEKACILPPHGAGAALPPRDGKGDGKGRRKHVLSAPLCFFLSVCPSAAES